MMNTVRINQLKLSHGIFATKPGGGGGGLSSSGGRHPLIRNIGNLFRAVELLLCLAVISRLSFNLPLAVALFRDFIHDLTATLASPRFVFVLGNAIVLTLFIKSGCGSGNKNRQRRSPHNHHRRKHADKSGSSSPESMKIVTRIFSSPVPAYATAVSLVSAKPPTYATAVSPVSAKPPAYATAVPPVSAKPPAYATAVPPVSAKPRPTVNCYRRSESEKVYSSSHHERERKAGEVNNDDLGRLTVLRRTKTERLEKRRSQVSVICCGGDQNEFLGHYPEDHMTSEEFRRTVENFIARQQRFLREEDEEAEEEEEEYD